MMGFTLVELIIALLILSFVMVLCASGFKFGTRVWDRVNSQSEQIDTLQAVQGFLRKSISHSIVKTRLRDDLDEDNERSRTFNESLFVGNEERIKYVSFSPQYGVDDYLYQYELYVDKKNNELALLYSPYNLALRGNQETKPLSIIEGVKSIKIKYFSGYVDEQSNESWLSKWDDSYSLPLLVKVDVTFIGDKQWPELVIPLRHGPYVIR